MVRSPALPRTELCQENLGPMASSEDSVHHSTSSCVVAVAASIITSNHDSRKGHNKWIDLADGLRA